ncbi:hypothetical protein SBOR_3626 [Sclerotinia borealis F-4128]|uniref:Uncharacterized protein n=1 Tax=Sclerotinia borealis (strain F-4128) TaxID=1432307 RepID=W9CJG5_SCLBF|nr:hypothetical protein SBOR_3626 [Sclerotinia borealis F-4128]
MKLANAPSQPMHQDPRLAKALAGAMGCEPQFRRVSCTWLVMMQCWWADLGLMETRGRETDGNLKPADIYPDQLKFQHWQMYYDICGATGITSLALESKSKVILTTEGDIGQATLLEFPLYITACVPDQVESIIVEQVQASIMVHITIIRMIGIFSKFKNRGISRFAAIWSTSCCSIFDRVKQRGAILRMSNEDQNSSITKYEWHTKEKGA